MLNPLWLLFSIVVFCVSCSQFQCTCHDLYKCFLGIGYKFVLYKLEIAEIANGNNL